MRQRNFNGLAVAIILGGFAVPGWGGVANNQDQGRLLCVMVASLPDLLTIVRENEPNAEDALLLQEQLAKQYDEEQIAYRKTEPQGTSITCSSNTHRLTLEKWTLVNLTRRKFGATKTLVLTNLQVHEVRYHRGTFTPEQTEFIKNLPPLNSAKRADLALVEKLDTLTSKRAILVFFLDVLEDWADWHHLTVRIGGVPLNEALGNSTSAYAAVSWARSGKANRYLSSLDQLLRQKQLTAKDLQYFARRMFENYQGYRALTPTALKEILAPLGSVQFEQVSWSSN